MTSEPYKTSAELPTTRVLFIDGDANDRALYGESLRGCYPDYQIIEATNGQSGLAAYRAQRIDCVVLELDIPDISGFEVLVDLVPIVRKPNIAVIVLTRLPHQGLWDLAKMNGAYGCFYKPHTSSDDLDRAINRAIGFVGQMPKEDRYRPI